MSENDKKNKLSDLSNASVTNDDFLSSLTAPEQIEETERKTMSDAGILLGSKERSATMVVRNHTMVLLHNGSRDFEMLPIAVALKRYTWLRENYWFRAISADYDEAVLKCAAQENPSGFFIHVKKGTKVSLPCQTAMYMADENIVQMLHNIVILEDDSSLELITGCMTHSGIKQGLHFAIEEHYIGKNAKLISTMVHSWGPDVTVYPRTGTIVKENGRYESNYISLRAAKEIHSDPKTYLNGKNASAKYLTVILSVPGSVIRTEGSIYLNAENTGAELAHRGVCTGGTMYQGGLLIGNSICKAHVDCAGMLLDKTGNGSIESVPGLRSNHPDARMSHEASIGKISPEQVEYLMSRGMEEREAISLMIRGFMGSEIEGLGSDLDAQIAEIAEIAGHGEN